MRSRGYVGMLVLVVTAALLLYIMYRSYLAPTAAAPASATSSTQGTSNLVQELNDIKKAAAAQHISNNYNAELQAALQQ